MPLLPVYVNPVVPPLTLTNQGLTADGKSLVLVDDTVYTTPARADLAYVVLVDQVAGNGDSSPVEVAGYGYSSATEFLVPNLPDGVLTYRAVAVLSQERVEEQPGNQGEVRYDSLGRFFFQNQDGDMAWLQLTPEEARVLLETVPTPVHYHLQLTQATAARNEVVLALLDDQQALQRSLNDKTREEGEERLEVTELVITGATFLYQAGNYLQAAQVLDRFATTRYRFPIPNSPCRY